jgi:DNA-binding transcriptional MerR regulator/effector-binding domain-containing protein
VIDARLRPVEVLLTIGEFSKMTYLSVKALRHYHDVGLLVPLEVDPGSGYRRYGASQVATAQAIRRFRDLGMPIDDVREVLGASDGASRNRAILAHLERMQAQLEQTQATVASLQSLLAGESPTHGAVEIRRLPATAVLRRHELVAFDDCEAWLTPALAELGDLAAAAGLAVVGADGALYADEFFEAGRGDVTAFVPVDGGDDHPAAVRFDPITVAVLVHDGPLADLDQAYAALGTVVAERGIGGPGPIREHYLTETSTEVCWPVTTGASL